MSILIDNKTKIKLITKIIIERINKIKNEKNKYLKKYSEKNLKINNYESIDFTGLKYGKEIKWEDLEVPLDKPIKLDFKIDLDLDELFYPKYPSFLLENNNKANNKDKKIEILIEEISDYIGKVEQLKPNIYDYYKVVKNSENEQTESDYINKKKIIIWNLQIKKELCVCWILVTKLYIEYSFLLNGKKKDTVYEFIENEENLIKSKQVEEYSVICSNLIELLYFLYNIKSLFDYLDLKGYLLSIKEIDNIIDKLKFILEYIKSNI
jgi:hypothetical protein